jgi:hypothetical protein
MRLVPVPVLAALAVAAFAEPATFPDTAAYLGTLKGKVTAVVPGLQKQKLKPNSPGSTLAIDGPGGKFTISTLDVTLTGTLAPGDKPGRFDVVQPTGPDLDVLIAGVEQYLDTASPVGVHVTDVQVTGLLAMKKAGAALKSGFVLHVTGTTDLLSLPFTADAKLKFKGKRTPQ